MAPQVNFRQHTDSFSLCCLPLPPALKLRFVYFQAIKVLIMKSKVLQKEIVDEGKVTALKL